MIGEIALEKDCKNNIISKITLMYRQSKIEKRYNTYMNFNKLVQIVEYILSKYNYKLNYTKLIKLLYLSDRECLDRCNFAISGDEYCSMRQGPVLSNLYDFIANKYNNPHQSEWNLFFETRGWNILSRNKSTNTNELSKVEKKILDEIDAKYHDKNQWYIIDYVAHELPEWNREAKEKNTSIPISKREILEALGKSKQEIEEVLNDEISNKNLRNMLNVQ